MKKFDLDKELSKVQNKNQSNFNASKINNMYVPILVIACSLLTFVGITFSANIVDDDKGEYSVKVAIVGNEDATYEKVVKEGAFSDTVKTGGVMGDIHCTSGNLNFDPLTSRISIPYLNQNTNCVITLMDSTNNIDIDGLTPIADGDGTSYYYKGDATNNYIVVNDMVFRILRRNGDGSLRLVLNDVILSSSYGEFNEYEGSKLQSVLERWFKENFNKQSYLIPWEYSYLNEIDYDTESLRNDEGYLILDVGTLSVSEAYVINKDVSSSYLNTANGFLLMNPNGTDNVWAFKNNEIVSVSKDDVLSVRPVINIRTDNITGSGTKYDPYVVEED